MRFAVSAALVAFAFYSALSAQEPKDMDNEIAKAMSRERKIQELSPEGEDAAVDRLRCGNHFLYQRGGVNGVLAFNAKRMEGDPPKVGFVFSFRKDRFTIVTDSSRPDPTIQAKWKNGVPESLIIRVSPAVRAASPCLAN